MPLSSLAFTLMFSFLVDSQCSCQALYVKEKSPFQTLNCCLYFYVSVEVNAFCHSDIDVLTHVHQCRKVRSYPSGVSAKTAFSGGVKFLF